MKVVGVDILSGSINSKAPPRYSVVLTENGEIISREEMSRLKLIRFIKKINPSRVAIDNIFELFNKKGIITFFSTIPDETQVIQVNGPPNDMLPLHIIAKKNGLKLGTQKKATSMEEAEACALLATKGVGHVVDIFEDKTRIIVSRARSPTKGGQSMDRYRRRVHNLVAGKITEIKDILKEQGIEYDLSARKADDGYSRGEFIVPNKKSKITGIKRSKGPDVQVKILNVEKEKMQFFPLLEEKKGVIIGVDPGTTTALAALDLEGNFIECRSSRDFSLEDIISYSSKFSKVVIVSTDVNPSPKFVEKLSTSMSAILYRPSKSLAVEEKLWLIDETFSRDIYSNPHERDALAAAIKAFKSYKNKIRQVDKKVDKLNLQHLKENIRKAVINGKSIDTAIKIHGEETENLILEDSKSIVIKDESKSLIKSLKNEIKILKNENINRNKIINEKEAENNGLKNKIKFIKREIFKEVLRDEKIIIKEKEIKLLKKKVKKINKNNNKLIKKLNLYKRLSKLDLSDDVVLFKVIPSFTRDSILEVKEKLMIARGDIIFFADTSSGGKNTGNYLSSLEPRAIIGEREKISHPAMEVLFTIPIINPREIDFKIVNEYGIVNKIEFEKILAEKIEEVEKEKINRKNKDIIDLIEEYKMKRELEIKKLKGS